MSQNYMPGWMSGRPVMKRKTSGMGGRLRIKFWSRQPLRKKYRLDIIQAQNRENPYPFTRGPQWGQNRSTARTARLVANGCYSEEWLKHFLKWVNCKEGYPWVYRQLNLPIDAEN